MEHPLGLEKGETVALRSYHEGSFDAKPLDAVTFAMPGATGEPTPPDDGLHGHPSPLARYNWALAQQEPYCLSLADGRVLSHVAMRDGPSWHAYQRQGNMAHDLNMSRRQVNRSLAQLERLGLIKGRRTDSGRISYTGCYPVPGCSQSYP